MIDFNTQLKKKADSIKMRSVEKRELRERIVAYMEYHPLPESLKAKAVTKAAAPARSAVTSEPFFALRFNTRYFQSAAVLATLLFVVGIPTLAEQALPGDILYAMKVNVNEEVRSTLSFSPYAKVEWEATRLERRLSEARQLAEAGMLTEDVEREVAEAVKEHSDSAQETILALRETDIEEAALAEIAFASVLDAQADIITLHEENAKLANADEGENTSGAVLALAVRDARTIAASAREEGQVTPERLFALIERETTYAEELLASIEDDANEKESRDIARRLADIGRKVEHAQTLQTSVLAMDNAPASQTTTAEAGSTTEEGIESMTMSIAAEPDQRAVAVADITATLRTALTDTRKLISFMTDIEIRQSVDVERLIPITWTNEERISTVLASLERTRAAKVEVESHILEERLVAKIGRGLTDVDLLLAQAERALEEKDVAQAESAATEAEALVNDMRTLVAGSEVKPVETVLDAATSTPTTTEQTGEAGEPASTTPEF